MAGKERITCEDFSQILCSFVAGELPETDRRRWEGHLERCAPCRRKAAEARSVLGLYRRLPEYDAPEVAIRNVLAAVPPPGRSLWRGIRDALDRGRPRRLWRPALAAAALGVGALLCLRLAPVQRADLRWEPIRMEAAISQVDSALMFQQQAVSFDTRRTEGTDRIWEEKAESLEAQIAALRDDITANGL